MIDDFSDSPLLPLILEGFTNATNSTSDDPPTFSNEHLAKIRVIRLPARVGLIRAKIAGAQFSTGSHLLFLDGHCRVVPGTCYVLLTDSTV